MTKILIALSLLAIGIAAIAQPAPTKIQQGNSIATQEVLAQVKLALKSPAKAADGLKEQIQQLSEMRATLAEKEAGAVLLFNNGSAFSYLVAVPFKTDKGETASFLATVGLGYSEKKVEIGEVHLSKGFTLMSIRYHPDKDVEFLVRP